MRNRAAERPQELRGEQIKNENFFGSDVFSKFSVPILFGAPKSTRYRPTTGLRFFGVELEVPPSVLGKSEKQKSFSENGILKKNEFLNLRQKFEDFESFPYFSYKRA